MTSELRRVLLAQTLALSGSVLLALGLRHPVRRWLGAATSCSMWLLVPASMVAVLLPHMQATGAAPTAGAQSGMPVSAIRSVVHFSFVAGDTDSPGAWPAWVMCAWIAGAAAVCCYFLAQQHAFERSLGIHSGSRRLLRSPTATCPAVMGLLRPKLILPADFRRRYTPLERRLILSHERAHLRRGDLAWNALVAVLRCLFWFNPLAHFAAACFRADQELACDAMVMLRHPGTRRTYAGAMLKTQLPTASLPLGCSWNSADALKERVRMLGQTLPGRARRTCGRFCVTLGCLAASFTAWAAQPAGPGSVTPKTAPTNSRSAGAPGLAPSGRGGSWCERWHPTKVFSGGGDDAMYAEDFNPDGTAAKVLIERSRGRVVEVAIATSARHTVTKDGMTHLFTLYDGAHYAGVPGSTEMRIMHHFDELTVQMEMPPQTNGLRNLDAGSTKELQSFMEKVTHILPCP